MVESSVSSSHFNLVSFFFFFCNQAVFALWFNQYITVNKFTDPRIWLRWKTTLDKCFLNLLFEAVVWLFFWIQGYFCTYYGLSYDPYGPRALSSQNYWENPRMKPSGPARIACGSLWDANWNNFVAKYLFIVLIVSMNKMMELGVLDILCWTCFVFFFSFVRVKELMLCLSLLYAQ